MVMPRHVGTVAAAVGTVLLLATASCGGRVKREEFDAEVARIREEMKAGDDSLAGRVDSTSRTLADHARRLDALEQELEAFRSEYNVGIERVKGMLRFDVPVHFEFGSSTLRSADRPVLDRFAAVVNEYYPGAVVTVEGLTDAAGSVAYNQALGLRRAETVKSYLASTAGLAKATLKAVSYGEARSRQVAPGAKGPGDAGLENRRVVLVIDHVAVASDGAALP